VKVFSSEYLFDFESLGDCLEGRGRVERIRSIVHGEGVSSDGIHVLLLRHYMSSYSSLLSPHLFLIYLLNINYI
jgi:hypothetical protein